MIRPGYYVEGRFFGGKVAQAEAFAQFRANEFGRSVLVERREYSGAVTVVKKAEPRRGQAA